MKVSYQGIAGSYSYQSALALFPRCEALGCLTFDQALDKVSAGECRYAVIPVENNLGGRVAEIHSLLRETPLSICGEYYLRIKHCLLGLPGAVAADLTHVHSHAQALAQARTRLESLKVALVAEADTATAAALVAGRGEPQRAAIASEMASAIHGLQVIESNFQDCPDNTTRFLIMAASPRPVPAGADRIKTALFFETRSLPSALFKALGGFATNGVNLSKLESYVHGEKFRTAAFYVEIEGHPGQTPVAMALEELSYFSLRLVILGSFPSATT